LCTFAVIESFLGDDSVDFWEGELASTIFFKFYSRGGWKVEYTCEDILESKLDVACIKGGRFNKRKIVLAWETVSALNHSNMHSVPYLQTAWPPL
jgi:hypothetical protein